LFDRDWRPSVSKRLQPPHGIPERGRIRSLGRQACPFNERGDIHGPLLENLIEELLGFAVRSRAAGPLELLSQRRPRLEIPRV
jgi:hypothetical protein